MDRIMIKTIMVVLLIGLLPSIGFASDVVAKVKTWGWTFTVNVEGDPWEKSCKLNLVADTYKLKREISLKREGVNCALFGPVHIYAAEACDRESVMVFFEAARGGDGDHSGPIVEVFKLTLSGFKKSGEYVFSGATFKKLGEYQLFDATYHRKDEQITSVTGTVLYSFCDTCDGPDGSPEENFYIPVKMIIGTAGISVKPTLSKQERKSVLEKFDAMSIIAINEHDYDKDYPEFVKTIRKELSTFLLK
jgi:hypothetical protein